MWWICEDLGNKGNSQQTTSTEAQDNTVKRNIAASLSTFPSSVEICESQPRQLILSQVTKVLW